MATTPTSRVTVLARKYRLDIDTGTYPTVAYSQLFGIEDLKLVEDLRTDDEEAYEDGGAGRDAVTGYRWKVEGKLALSTNLAGSTLDTVQAFLRGKFTALRSSSAQTNEFGVQFYNRDGLTDGTSCEGRAYVKEWKQSGGSGREVIDFTLMGQGALTNITNPLGSAAPVITSLVPAAAGTAAGGIIQIFGQKFTGATAVSFGGVAATNFSVVNDGLIVATKPALTTGTKDTLVTTPSGSNTNTTADDLVIT